MSTLQVNNIQLNQEGNAAISIANSYNVVISVDGTEKVKLHQNGIDFSSGITINNVPVISGSGGLLTLPDVGNSGNVFTSNGTYWVSKSPVVSDPVGTIKYFSGSPTSDYPGSSWLACNGAIYLQNSYPTLYNRIGKLFDGVYTWSTLTNYTDAQYVTYSLLYANNIFVAGTQAAAGLGAIRTSTNAITWTNRTSSLMPSGFYAYGLAYGQNTYVYVSRNATTNGTIGTSSDAITWTTRSYGVGYRAVIFANNIFVAAGYGTASYIATSTDAITWTARTAAHTANTISALAYGNGIYVYGGSGGALATSTDGITWTARTSVGVGTQSITALTYGNGIFVYGGSTIVPICTSTDGITWTARTTVTGTIQSLFYKDGLYIYCGGNTTSGIVGTSTDGITWKSRTSGSSNVIYSLAYGDNKFIYGDEKGYIGYANQYSYNSNTQFVTPVIENISSISEINLNPYIKAE